MHQAPLFLAVVIALAVAAGVTGFAIVLRSSSARRARQQRLDEISSDATARMAPEAQQQIMRDQRLTSLPEPVDALLRRQPLVRKLKDLLAQGDMSITVGKFMALMLILAVVGGAIAYKSSHFWPSVFIGAPALASIPVYVAVHKKRRRLAAFEKNFADSLDILTSALRAGLAFSAAVQVVAEESPEPVSKEFSLVFEENRLGLDMKEALRNLARRVDCAELRMFVTAVILQRETGGNLAEILDGTADVIRDRFRILGEVRAMTAQQRFSGLILSVLPLVMAALLMVTAPDYMLVLLKDAWGPYLIMGALFLQLVGYLAIKKIVAIKV